MGWGRLGRGGVGWDGVGLSVIKWTARHTAARSACHSTQGSAPHGAKQPALTALKIYLVVLDFTK